MNAVNEYAYERSSAQSSVLCNWTKIESGAGGSGRQRK